MLHRPATTILLIAAMGSSAIARAQPVGQGFGAGVVRYFESQAVAERAPSFVLERPPRTILPVPDDYALKPAFSEAGGKHIVAIPVPPDASLYGLGRLPGSLLRNGVPATEVQAPWVLGIRADGTAFGVLADTPRPCSVDLAGGIVFSSETPTIPVICFDGPGPDQVLAALANTAGITEMPPRWALGLQVIPGTAGPVACASWLREARIPADTVWLPVPSSDDELERPGLSIERGVKVKSLHEHRFRVVLPITGIVRAPEDSPLIRAGVEGAHWIQTSDGAPWKWPADAGGLSPDLSRDETRRWWAGLIRQAAKDGINGFAGCIEPPPASAGAILRSDDAPAGAAAAAAFRTVFGTLATRALWQGAGGEAEERRPFVISEAGALSTQRTSAAVIRSAGELDAAAVLRQALSSGLSAMPLVAAEASLAGDDAAAARAAGLGSMLPIGIVRLDGPLDSKAATDALRRAAERRSRLIPYLYSLCFFNFRYGEPILRPLALADPADSSLRGIDTMFLLGKDLLVVPRLGALPKPTPPLTGAWRKIDLGDGDHPDLPDLYLRPGGILPLGPVMQRSDEVAPDPLTILVNLDDQGNAAGELYEDQGDGYGFFRNQCRLIRYEASLREGSVYVRLGKLDGGEPLPRRRLEVHILTASGALSGMGSERGTIRIDLPAPKNDP